MTRTSVLTGIAVVVIAISLAPVVRAQNSATPGPIPDKGPWTCTTNPTSCPHVQSGPPESQDQGLCVQITNVGHEITSRNGNDKCWQIEGAFNQEPAKPNAGSCTDADRLCRGMVGVMCETHTVNPGQVSKYMQIISVNTEYYTPAGAPGALIYPPGVQPEWSGDVTAVNVTAIRSPGEAAQWTLAHATGNNQCRLLK
jgi:hypothetical protein